MSNKEVKELIRKYRPNIKDITIDNYSKYLNKISKHFKDEKFNVKDIDMFKKTKDVMKYLKELPLSTQKALIASILVILNNDDKYDSSIKKYRKYLEVVNSSYELERSKKQKNIKESKNWTTMKELENIRQQLKKKVERQNIYKKTNLKQHEYDLLRNYIISALYTYKPPRRNIYRTVEYISKKAYNKLKDDELKKNYLVHNGKILFFHFGNQKSSNFNNQVLDIPKPLKRVIRAYMRHPTTNINDGELFLRTYNGRQLSTQGLTNIISKIFTIGDKHVSSSLLRKIYVSEVVKPHADIVNNAAKEMGHSTSIANKHYTKN